MGAHLSRLHNILISLLILQEMAEVKEEAALPCSHNYVLVVWEDSKKSLTISEAVDTHQTECVIMFESNC